MISYIPAQLIRFKCIAFQIFSLVVISRLSLVSRMSSLEILVGSRIPLKLASVCSYVLPGLMHILDCIGWIDFILGVDITYN